MQKNSTNPNGFFISTVEAGKQFGYTNDYVSRLAREKKVIANRVGRQWFVDAGSFELYVKESDDAKKRYAEQIRLERKRERVSMGISSETKSSVSIDIFPNAAPRAQVLAKSGAVLCASVVVGSFIFLASQNLPSGELSSASVFQEVRSAARGIYFFGKNIGGVEVQQSAALGDSMRTRDGSEVAPAPSRAQREPSSAVIILPEESTMTEKDIIFFRQTPRLVELLQINVPEHPENKLDPDLLLALNEDRLGSIKELVSERLRIRVRRDLVRKVHAEVLVEALEDAAPIPVLRRLLWRA